MLTLATLLIALHWLKRKWQLSVSTLSVFAIHALLYLAAGLAASLQDDEGLEAILRRID